MDEIILLLLTLQACMSVDVVAIASDHNATESVVERIIRRQIDIYYVIESNSSKSCREEEKDTYLISEKQCVQDKELFKSNVQNLAIGNSLVNHHHNH